MNITLDSLDKDEKRILNMISDGMIIWIYPSKFDLFYLPDDEYNRKIPDYVPDETKIDSDVHKLLLSLKSKGIIKPIQVEDKPIRTWVIRTNEEMEMYEDVVRIVKNIDSHIAQDMLFRHLLKEVFKFSKTELQILYLYYFQRAIYKTTLTWREMARLLSDTGRGNIHNAFTSGKRKLKQLLECLPELGEGFAYGKMDKYLNE